MQLLPADQDFASGTPDFGTRPLLYVGCEPRDADYEAGLLHDGYVAATANVTGGATFATCQEVGVIDEDVPRGWLFVNELAEDVIVECTFFAFAGYGLHLGGYVAENGVVARWRNGTLANNNTTSVSLKDGDCYLGWLRGNRTTGAVTWGVSRYNSGTETQLATTTWLLAQVLGASFTQPYTLSLELETDGTDVNYALKLRGMKASNGVTPLAGFTLLSGTDSSGSNLRTAGRCGFTMGPPIDTTTPTAHGSSNNITAFQVAPHATPSAPVLRDEFYRLGATVSLLVGPDKFGVSGRSMQSMFTWDQFTGASSPIWSHATDEVEKAQSGGLEARPAIFTRPADNPYAQHRSMRVEIPTGSGEVAVGICLRSLMSGTGDDGTGVFGLDSSEASGSFVGYVAFCHYDGSDYFVGIRRYDGVINNGELIAVLESGSALFPVDGTSFTLDFEIYPDFGPRYINAPAVMKVSLDTGSGLTQQALVAPGVSEGNSSGITIDASGTVIDNSSKRIARNYGEGFYEGANGSSRTVVIDDWQQETLTNTVDPDAASIAIAGEGTPTDDLSDFIQPDWEVDRLDRIEGLSVGFDSMHKHTRPVAVGADGAATQRDLWVFSKAGVTSSELGVLRGFFNEKGAEEPFYFTDEDQVQQAVAFVEDSLVFEAYGPHTYTVEFRIQETL